LLFSRDEPEFFVHFRQQVDAKSLQDLALQIARLPRADRLQFIHAVLSLSELENVSEVPLHPEPVQPAIDLHEEAVLVACREKLARVRELTAHKGWGHTAAALLAGVLYVGQQGSWDAFFTTPLLNRTIVELGGAVGWSLNVQSLHGLERKAMLKRRPDTHPVQFCFTVQGYQQARKLAERAGP
jgi:hypothetical protein